MGDIDTSSRENTRITLGLLEAVEAGRVRTQRALAADLGIALGLVNVYLKRCVTKGLVKVAQAPARRYAYYLTPQGFAEKSRLTGEYLSWSLTFFRRAKDSCRETLGEAAALGWKRVALAGSGDLADIARICAGDSSIEILAVVDSVAPADAPTGAAAAPRLLTVPAGIDGVIVTDLTHSLATYEAAVAAVGPRLVLAPSVVPVRQREAVEVME